MADMPPPLFSGLPQVDLELPNLPVSKLPAPKQDLDKHDIIKILSSVVGTLDNILDGTTPPIHHRRKIVKAEYDLSNLIDQLRSK